MLYMHMVFHAVSDVRTLATYRPYLSILSLSPSHSTVTLSLSLPISHVLKGSGRVKVRTYSILLHYMYYLCTCDVLSASTLSRENTCRHISGKYTSL